MKKRWVLRQEPADFKGLAAKLGVSPVVVRCIRNRGPETEDEMRSYLYAGMDELYDPMIMPGVAEAVELLAGGLAQTAEMQPAGASEDSATGVGVPHGNTLEDGMAAGSAQTQATGAGVPHGNTSEDGMVMGFHRIAIASDYDCDGICSGMILKNGLEALGFETNIYTPDRVREGYGLNRRIVDDAVRDGCELLITCDNGIAANDAVSYAKEKGLTVIVTDHHEPQEELPCADVIIDPKADEMVLAAVGAAGAAGSAGTSMGAEAGSAGTTAEASTGTTSVISPYPYPGLCGAGVAYKLIEALYDKRGLAIGTDLLELAAIATITDVMELVDENRIIVKYGLQALRRTENKGLRNLLKLLRLDDVPIKASDISFRLGPTLNATGRIADVEDAFLLLSETDETKAKKLAEKLVSLNDERKQMMEDGTNTALDMLYKDFPDADKGLLDDVLVVYVPGVHESIVGLIAGRIKERFNHPVITFTDGLCDGSTGAKNLKGSGRSIKGYHMFDRLMDVKDLTSAFGGHEMAAGLTIPEANLDTLREKLNANSGLNEDDFVPELAIDLEVPLSYLSERLIDEIDKMGPFGVANPRPVFAVRNLHIDRVQYMGKEKQHLKLYVKEDSGTVLEAVAFFRAAEFDDEIIAKYNSDELDAIRRGCSDKLLTLAYQPEINEFNGFRQVQLKIVEWSF